MRYNSTMGAKIYIGTSGWHYADWMGRFYPATVTGYHELAFHAKYFNTVENNSSFYRIATENTYKTWNRMTPDNYTFSIKLNRSITHMHRLALTDDVKEKVTYILNTTQVLKEKLGAILIQLPASFRADTQKLATFLEYFCQQVRSYEQHFDIAIEFRNKYWLNEATFSILKKYNIALVDSQSSRWPEAKQVTADIAYIRMHGPKRLFASKYSQGQLEAYAKYIRGLKKSVTRIYVYFNNDFHGYAIDNARGLRQLLDN